MYPYADTREKATAQYGNIAIVTLIRMMKSNGANLSKVQAQIFGGAFNPKESNRNVGRENFKAARDILNGSRIKIVSEDIGGELGRKVVFNTATCEIVILKVDRLRNSDWYPYRSER